MPVPIETGPADHPRGGRSADDAGRPGGGAGAGSGGPAIPQTGSAGARDAFALLGRRPSHGRRHEHERQGHEDPARFVRPAQCACIACVVSPLLLRAIRTPGAGPGELPAGPPEGSAGSLEQRDEEHRPPVGPVRARTLPYRRQGTSRRKKRMAMRPPPRRRPRRLRAAAADRARGGRCRKLRRRLRRAAGVRAHGPGRRRGGAPRGSCSAAGGKKPGRAGEWRRAPSRLTGARSAPTGTGPGAIGSAVVTGRGGTSAVQVDGTDGVGEPPPGCDRRRVERRGRDTRVDCGPAPVDAGRCANGRRRRQDRGPSRRRSASSSARTAIVGALVDDRRHRSSGSARSS